MKQTTEYDSTKTLTGLPAPAGWHIIERRDDGLMGQRLRGEAIKVIESVRVEEDDGLTWLHVSVSKPNGKLPIWEDIQTARKLFVGEHRESYQKFPPKERYVDIHNALHLWCCLDRPDGVLPRFEGEIVLRGKRQLSI